jgi:uncharacterized oligopeptide transporter (OPT) family protein
MKVGYWVGGTPRRIQCALLSGSTLASLTVTAVILLFAHTQGYVASPSHPDPMPAPQANAMAAVIRSVMASNEAPWFLYGLGAVIAAVMEIVGVSGLAFALGMYLPMELNTPLLAGALVSWCVARSARGDEALAKARNDRGTLVASGFIAGGALAGVLKGATDALESGLGTTFIPKLGILGAGGNVLGLGVFALLAAGLYLDAAARRRG